MEVEEDAKRAIIETHPQRQGVLEQVIRGETSFYQLGEPIIKRSEEVEHSLNGRRFAYLSHRRILGKDARDGSDVLEATNYLREQEIIEPRNFFGDRRLIVSGLSQKALSRIKATSVYGDLSAGSCVVVTSATILAMMITGVSFDNAFGTFLLIAELGGVFTTVPFVKISTTELVNPNNNGIAKNREEFSDALKYLDNEVRRLYN